MIKTYKNKEKSFIIEAIQFDGWNWAECYQFMSSELLDFPDWVIRCDGIEVDTLEGKVIAYTGDYVIKGVEGEFYPCKPDIFEQTYEEVINSND